MMQEAFIDSSSMLCSISTPNALLTEISSWRMSCLTTGDKSNSLTLGFRPASLMIRESKSSVVRPVTWLLKSSRKRSFVDRQLTFMRAVSSYLHSFVASFHTRAKTIKSYMQRSEQVTLKFLIMCQVVRER
mgnify:CR=1 FL=1